VANYREKGKEVDKNIEEGQKLTLSMPLPMMFPGLNREGEMSAMVSALTHVICGDQNNGGGDDYNVLNQNMNHNAFEGDGIDIKPFGSSISLAYGGNSALKRRREDGGFFGNSSSPIAQIKHQGEYLYDNLIKQIFESVFLGLGSGLFFIVWISLTLPLPKKKQFVKSYSNQYSKWDSPT